MLWMEASAATCIFVSSVDWATVSPLYFGVQVPFFFFFFHVLFDVMNSLFAQELVHY